MKEALTQVTLQLEEQLRFYGEIGVADIGGSLPVTQAAVVARLSLAPAVEPVTGQEVESLAPEPADVQDDAVKPRDAESQITQAALPSTTTAAERTTLQKVVAPASAAPPQTGLFGDLAPPPAAPKVGLPVLDLRPQDASLEAIRADIGDCTRCKLHEHRTRIVFGEGNPHAQLMFVGEGPGADEDATGRPFVGRAGQLLDKIIAAIGKKREEVYIGNVVKCRPPQNRTPERDEVETCQPFLFRQIALIQPKVIVALGSPAFQCLFNTKEGISRARGEFRDWNGIKVMPTFHPAYLLRSPDKKREAWEDMKKVRDYLNTLAG